MLMIIFNTARVRQIVDKTTIFSVLHFLFPIKNEIEFDKRVARAYYQKKI